MTADAGRPASSDSDPSAPVPADTDAPEHSDAPPLAPPTSNGQEPAPPDASANGDVDLDPEAGSTYEPAVLRAAPGDPLDLQQVPGTAHPGKRRKPATRVVIEWIVVLAAALGAALLVQAFVLKAFFIPSGSMRPTLQVNDRVLVNKLSYRFGDVQRGDLIVFHKPDDAPASDVNDFIKRVIAIEGDVIEDRDGRVYVNGRPVEETYLPDDAFTTGIGRQTVPEDHVFVMGDNRNFSVDSRVFGPIEESSIIGEAVLRVWPPSHLGRL